MGYNHSPWTLNLWYHIEHVISNQEKTPYPADIRRLINVGLTLVQRRRRWTNVRRIVDISYRGLAYIPYSKVVKKRLEPSDIIIYDGEITRASGVKCMTHILNVTFAHPLNRPVKTRHIIGSIPGHSGWYFVLFGWRNITIISVSEGGWTRFPIFIPHVGLRFVKTLWLRNGCFG